MKFTGVVVYFFIPGRSKSNLWLAMVSERQKTDFVFALLGLSATMCGFLGMFAPGHFCACVDMFKNRNTDASISYVNSFNNSYSQLVTCGENRKLKSQQENSP